MPKYRNDGAVSLTLEVLYKNKLLENEIRPGEIFTTLRLYDTVPGLTKLSLKPVFEPVLQSQTLVFEDTTEVEVEIPEEATSIYITEITSCKLSIKLNSSSTTAFKIGDSPWSIESLGRVNKLVITPTQAGTCIVSSLKE